MILGVKIKVLVLAVSFGLSLIAQPACARVINAAPNGSASATLADIKNSPNAATSLTQTLALLKATTLRTSSVSVGASAAGEPANSNGSAVLTTNDLVSAASRELFGKDEA